MKVINVFITIIVFSTFLLPCFAQEDTPEEYIVKVVYFVSKDREPPKDVDAKIKGWLKESQKFFADQLEKHGYGRKTFRVETDVNGNMVVHHVIGKKDSTQYQQRNPYEVFGECAPGIQTRNTILFVVLDHGSSAVGGAGGLAFSGARILVPITGGWGVVAHELGHTFSLPHDFRDNSYIMGYGSYVRYPKLSQCAAQWLNVSPYFIISSQQSKLLVTALGRHSSGGNLSNDAVYQLHALHAAALGQNDIANRNWLITRGGFSLKLLTGENDIVDHIGTLIDDRQAWQLPECLINGVRSSLIRRFDAGVPRSGLERRGWSRAVDAKRLPAGLYYGDQRDLGTPGYRSGKPLPVALSQFSARFDTDQVIINWTTESELNNAGFNILRSTSRTENFHPVNAKLIQGAGTTGERNTYQFIDKTVLAAKPDVAYYYRLEDIDFAGHRTLRTTYRLRGVIAPDGKQITTWGTLKDNR